MNKKTTTSLAGTALVALLMGCSTSREQDFGELSAAALADLVGRRGMTPGETPILAEAQSPPTRLTEAALVVASTTVASAAPAMATAAAAMAAASATAMAREAPMVATAVPVTSEAVRGRAALLVGPTASPTGVAPNVGPMASPTAVAPRIARPARTAVRVGEPAVETVATDGTVSMVAMAGTVRMEAVAAVRGDRGWADGGGSGGTAGLRAQMPAAARDTDSTGVSAGATGSVGKGCAEPARLSSWRA
jgi:hypothetical protein